MHPELIADTLCHTGENPLWHPTERRVYWTDIPNGRLYRYDPATGAHESCYSGEPVGGFTLQADGALLLFMARGAVAVWREGRLYPIIDELPDEHDSRFNDVIADPAGRVFCGTMSTRDRPGRLYRLDTDGSIRTVLEGIGVSNGLGFTLDRKRLYYTDSPARKVYLFDYDERTGDIANRRVFVETPEGEGFPDGLTVDAEGAVWSARWDGSALYRYTPAGAVERRIAFPARKVSSLTFGGDDLTDMYITTACVGKSRAEEGAGAGALFHLNLGIRGLPEFTSRVGLTGA
ncbi:MAG: SMP-30/gluconolactonase/LRE family protein [Chloroflexi bacterium]|nr:SMP-30/gluconolactonase/LRE family protein [Chloroflexota bacterium]